MRRTMTALAAVLLLAGCGGTDTAPPEVTISEASWSGDEITVTAGSNLPDGAILSWYVVEGDDWDDLDAVDLDGFATVTDGTATASIDVADFTADQALVDVSFVPGYGEQPADVQDAYDPNQGAEDETSVSRG